MIPSLSAFANSTDPVGGKKLSVLCVCWVGGGLQVVCVLEEVGEGSCLKVVCCCCFLGGGCLSTGFLLAFFFFFWGGGGRGLFVYRLLLFLVMGGGHCLSTRGCLSTSFFFGGGGLFVWGCLFFVCVLEGVGGCLSTVFFVSALEGVG